MRVVALGGDYDRPSFLDNRMTPSFWQRFGTAIVLGSLILLFAGLMVYASATEEIDQGNDKPMGVVQR